MEVHPRLRGELEYPCRKRSGYFGSSPLARGTHSWRNGQQESYRFIPACAGNSSNMATNTRQSPVHPRLRGELQRGRAKGLTNAGSSPLARGTLDEDGLDVQALRFIPACAGNSRQRRGSLKTIPVHPRLRGELT